MINPLNQSIHLADIRKLLRESKPLLVETTNRREAAVSLLLSEDFQGTELLLIERAHRDGDPWSGQMAFPGGRREFQDETILDTAIRETAEEIGVHLDVKNRISRIDDLVAPRLSHAHGLIISCHVFEARRPIHFDPNEEVHDLVWIPMAYLLRPDSHTSEYRPPDYDGVFSGFRIGDEDNRIIWGLTYRIICSFFRTLNLADY